jgi:hypothetical protein
MPMPIRSSRCGARAAVRVLIVWVSTRIGICVAAAVLDTGAYDDR